MDPAALRAWRLPFGHGWASIDTDPQHCAELLSHAGPLTQFDALGGERAFFSRGAFTQIGSTPISCGIHSPVMATNGDNQDKLTLTLPLVGEATIKVGGQSFCSRYGESAVLLTGESGQALTSTYASVLVNLKFERLAKTSAVLSGGRRLSRLLPTYQNCHCFLDSDPAQGHLLGVLRRTFSMIDHLPWQEAQHPSALAMERVIYKCMALLLHPELRQNP
ncbi:MAG: hypothetical protein WD136_04910 [Cyanobium sp.]